MNTHNLTHTHTHSHTHTHTHTASFHTLTERTSIGLPHLTAKALSYIPLASHHCSTEAKNYFSPTTHTHTHTHTHTCGEVKALYKPMQTWPSSTEVSSSSDVVHMAHSPHAHTHTHTHTYTHGEREQERECIGTHTDVQRDRPLIG